MTEPRSKFENRKAKEKWRGDDQLTGKNLIEEVNRLVRVQSNLCEWSHLIMICRCMVDAHERRERARGLCVQVRKPRKETASRDDQSGYLQWMTGQEQVYHIAGFGSQDYLLLPSFSE
jgi:hypothetical protein